MNFLIFQPLKSHMFPNLKNMRTIMLKNLLQMLNPRNTKFRTIPNQLNPQLQNLYFFSLIPIINVYRMLILHEFGWGVIIYVLGLIILGE